MKMPHLAYLVLTLMVSLASGCASEPLPLEVRTLTIPDKNYWEPFGIIEKDGDIFVSDGQNGRILRCSGQKGFEVFADGLHTPSHLAFDPDGNLIVADTGANTIVRVKAGNKRTVIAGRSGIAGISEGVATESLLNGPIGIVVDGQRIIVSDTYNDRIVEIADGKMRTLAGKGRGFIDGPRSEARFDTPSGLLLLPDGTLLIADTGNSSVRKMNADGRTSTIGKKDSAKIIDGPLENSSFEEPVAFARNSNGDIFVIDSDSIRKIGATTPRTIITLNSREGGFQDGGISESRFSRPSGIAITSTGEILIADSDNGLIRVFGTELGRTLSVDEFHKSIPSAEEFRSSGPARWPFDPPQTPRDVAGTLGELRGEIGESDGWRSFHNGLDIAGAYGETTVLVRDEKALGVISTRFLGSNRELVRFPRMGYIHLRIGRDANEKPFDDPRFLFEFAEDGTPESLRIKRGTKFSSSEAIGTLNSQNHVHLIAGRYGYEYNAIVALDLPGLQDTVAPTIESVELVDIESNLKLSEPFEFTVASKVRAIAVAWDRKDLNPDRRRLGIFEAGYEIVNRNDNSVAIAAKSISFRGLPDGDAVRMTYADGSRSGASGVTVFRYIIGNTVSVEGSKEGSIDLSRLAPGDYELKIFVTDSFRNRADRAIPFKIISTK